MPRKKNIQDIARQRLLQSQRRKAAGKDAIADNSNKFQNRLTSGKNISAETNLPFTPFAPRDVKKPKKSDYGS